VASELDINAERMTANEGQITLIANGTGKNSVPLQPLNNTKADFSGDINIAKTYFDVRGDGGGSVVIQGGEIILSESNITADNDGDSSTDHQINIKAQNLLMNQSVLDADTIAEGNGVDVIIDVDEKILLENKSNISMKTEIDSMGDSGDITISADQFILQDHSHITSSTISNGQAGNIHIAARQVYLDGYDYNGTGAGVEIFSSSLSDVKLERVEGELQAVKYQALGNAGKISIEAEQVDIVNAAKISTSTYAKGNAGKIIIEADHLNIDSGAYVGDYYNLQTKEPDPIKTGIFSSSSVYSEFVVYIDDDEYVRKTIVLPATGNAGLISIDAGVVQVNQGGQISTNTLTIGDAGTIKLNADQLSIDSQGFLWKKTIDGITYSGSWFTGLVSDSHLFTEDMASDRAGNAGTLKLNVDQLNIKLGGVLISSSSTSGLAGSIDINSSNIILDKAAIISIVGQDGQIFDTETKPSINIHGTRVHPKTKSFWRC